MLTAAVGLNCAAFVAGIVKGILDGSHFVCPLRLRRRSHVWQPAKVSAHFSEDQGTAIMIKFDRTSLPAEAFDVK